MLKRLLFCPSSLVSRYNYKPSYKSAKKFEDSDSVSFSWPLSIVFYRPIKYSRVLAMADDGSSKTASSKPQTHSNRLAAEHSPYLLQHAHNPVISCQKRFFFCGIWFSWNLMIYFSVNRLIGIHGVKRHSPKLVKEMSLSSSQVCFSFIYIFLNLVFVFVWILICDLWDCWVVLHLKLVTALVIGMLSPLCHVWFLLDFIKYVRTSLCNS